MKNVLCLLLLSVLGFFAQAQAPNLKWQKALGGTSFDAIYSVIQCSDGNFVIIGTVDSAAGDVTLNHGLYDLWVVKLSPVGSIIWQKSFGGTNSDYAASVQQTTDGGYIVAGYTRSTDGDVTGNHGMIDAWVLKLSNTGALQWQKALGGSGFDAALSVRQTADGGYIVGGWSASSDGDLTTNNGNEDCWVVKLTSSGAISWKHSLGGSGEEHANSVTQTSDGGYIVAGSSKSTDFNFTSNHGGGDNIVYKLTSSGSLVWLKCLGGSGNEYNGDHGYAGKIEQTVDGGYIISGWSNSNNGNVSGNHGGIDAWIVKLNDTGGIKWQKSFGGSGDDEANDIHMTSDGGYIIAGLSNSMNGQVTGGHGGYDFWVWKADSAGNLLWQQCYGGSDYEIAYNIERTSNGNYVVVGVTKSNDGQITGMHGDYDGWVAYLEDPMKTEEIAGVERIVISPNPTTGELAISNIPSASEIRIFNNLGQIVHQASNTANVSIKGLSQGIYYLWIYSGDGKLLKREKLVKM